MKIGSLARKADVSIDTIRYYERRGILPEPERLASGYRIYSEAIVNRVIMAKSLQKLGFTLDEIAISLNNLDVGKLNCETGEPSMEMVLERVETKIDLLLKVKQNIESVLSDCRAGNCRIKDFN